MKNRNRKTMAILACLALAAAVLIPAGAAAAGKTITVTPGWKIYLNSQELEMKDEQGNSLETFNYNGTNYLPIRAVAEAFGLDVSYDAASGSGYLSGGIEAPDGSEFLGEWIDPVSGLVLLAVEKFTDTNFKLTVATEDETGESYTFSCAYGQYDLHDGCIRYDSMCTLSVDLVTGETTETLDKTAGYIGTDIGGISWHHGLHEESVISLISTTGLAFDDLWVDPVSGHTSVQIDKADIDDWYTVEVLSESSASDLVEQRMQAWYDAATGKLIYSASEKITLTYLEEGGAQVTGVELTGGGSFAWNGSNLDWMQDDYADAGAITLERLF